jgi:hypothetical protein
MRTIDPMLDRHPDGSLRLGLTDGNTVRLRSSPDGRTTLTIVGPAGGYHGTIRLTEAEVRGLIAALATSGGEGEPALGYRDAMTP